MKILLVAVDAKYIHTNLAVRSIAAYHRERGGRVEIAEYTINQRPRWILEELVGHGADVYLFSCYIWNVELVCRAAGELHKLLPNALLLAGGPEADAHPAEFLQAHPHFGGVVLGEGEETCHQLFLALERGEDWRRVPGIATAGLQGDRRALPDLDALPFPYPDKGGLAHRIPYYESMRGCPFRCAYCLSSASEGVRMRSLAQTLEHLDRFLAWEVPQVKLVDRTFNCDPARSRAVWRHLMERDNGVTNFHFELAGELLDDESLSLLAQARPGQFQFEIGVQSAHRPTLKAIRRPADLERLAERVERLRAPGNIHLHLDLIAGLPFEDLAAFGRSFDWVYRLRPHQLQLGFLKVLAGSEAEARADQWGIVCESEAPYQVLRTRWLGFAELAELGRVAEMVETYYNSGRFVCLAEHLCAGFGSPFAFYRALAAFWQQRGHAASPLSKLGYYQLLGDFMAAQGLAQDERAQWLCRYDMACHERIRALPDWVEVDGTAARRADIRRFYRDADKVARYLPAYRDREPAALSKLCPIEVFPAGIVGRTGEDVALLFDYRRRDALGRALPMIVEL